MSLDTLVILGCSAAAALIGLSSGGHALLHKRDPRSQLAWSMTCVLLPVLGPIFYWFFGINRIQTRARQWQERGLFEGGRELGDQSDSATALEDNYPEMAENMALLLQISKRVTKLPLLADNQIDVLHSGEQTYPAMLEAIAGARSYVFLCSYLFEGDETGRRFADALVLAGARGVDVRVLVDAIGGKIGRREIGQFLRNKKGVRFERFLPPSLSKRLFRLNLRNHRKILVVDGDCAFTGGINISDRHLIDDEDNRTPTQDLHFRLRGPIVQSLEEVFSEDWCFRVGRDEWPKRAAVAKAGTVLCRGIRDGPNEDFEKLQWILIGALTCARRSVRIQTPYFIPSRELLSALRMAVLRGAEVDIVLPEKSNLVYVDWATRSLLPEVIEFGIRVYLQPAPFDHSKLLVIDDFYVNLGSANLDPRSLLLNFEFNVEAYDPALAETLSEHHETVRKRSTLLTLEALASRTLPVRLRDAFAKIFSPYL